MSEASSAVKSRSTAAASSARCAADHDLAPHRPEAVCAHEVWVDACGGLDDCEGPTEPESKNEPLCSASWLMRDDTSRPPLAAGVLPSGAARVGAADDEREGAEARHRHTRRHGLQEASAPAGGSEAGGGGWSGHGSIKAGAPENDL